MLTRPDKKNISIKTLFRQLSGCTDIHKYTVKPSTRQDFLFVILFLLDSYVLTHLPGNKVEICVLTQKWSTNLIAHNASIKETVMRE